MANEFVIDNLPNRLTIFRMVLVPLVIGSLFVIDQNYIWAQKYQITLGWFAGWTFVLAAITDFFDGFIARRRKIVTIFGSFLDPIADKFLIVSSLVMLLALERLPALVVVILILREFYITSLRLLASSQELTVPVDNLGKWKTAVQMIGIPLLMANQKPWGLPMGTLGLICIYVATLLSLTSAIGYSMRTLQKIKQKRKKTKGPKDDPTVNDEDES